MASAAVGRREAPRRGRGIGGGTSEAILQSGADHPGRRRRFRSCSPCRYRPGNVVRAKSLLDHVRDGTFRPRMHTAVLAREALPVKPPDPDPTPARRRQRAAQPDAPPWTRQRPGVVARRPEDRLRDQARRQLRGLCHERRRERAAEPDSQPRAGPRSCLVAWAGEVSYRGNAVFQEEEVMSRARLVSQTVERVQEE